jgi:transcriptional regulator with XRE-family HTH domain
MVPLVGTKPDMTPAVSKVRNEQAARLTRLRELLDLGVGQAAEYAGVSRHSWKRMETGEANIDAVALARFLREAKLPAEYVVTGGYAGLPDALVKALVAAELPRPPAAEEQTSAGAGRARRGRPRRIGTERSAHEETAEAPEPEPDAVTRKTDARGRPKTTA